MSKHHENKYIIGCDYSNNHNDFTIVMLFTIADDQISTIYESKYEHKNLSDKLKFKDLIVSVAKTLNCEVINS